jgi:hypothetical protein
VNGDLIREKIRAAISGHGEVNNMSDSVNPGVYAWDWNSSSREG